MWISDYVLNSWAQNCGTIVSPIVEDKDFLEYRFGINICTVLRSKISTSEFGATDGQTGPSLNSHSAIK